MKLKGTLGFVTQLEVTLPDTGAASAFKLLNRDELLKQAAAIIQPQLRKALDTSLLMLRALGVTVKASESRVKFDLEE